MFFVFMPDYFAGMVLLSGVGDSFLSFEVPISNSPFHTLAYGA